MATGKKMRRSLVVFLLFASLVGGAQIEPESWRQYFDWQTSLQSGDVEVLTQFLKQRAAHDAHMRHPFRHEAVAEMELLVRVGGGLTWQKTVNLSDKEMHVILKGKDEKSWVEAVIRVGEQMPNKITAIELRQIAGPNPEISRTSETDGNAKPRPVAPELISPKNGEVFTQFPRDTRMSWTAVPGATGYWLEWDFKDGDAWHSTLPNAKVVRIELEETNYTFRFVGAQMGRWRVIAFDQWGVAGEPSEWREFRYLH
jgi:hypothetical protein